MKKLVCLLFIACSLSCGDNEVDVTAPTIENLNITPAPSTTQICGGTDNNVISLVGGETLAFDAVFSDNSGLSQYKIDLHSNFDCHGHDGSSVPSVAVPSVNAQTEDWAVLDIVNLEGTDQNVNRSLEVPSNVTAGNYHFQIQVLDAAGNDDPLANVYTLKVQNSTDVIVPSLSLISPSDNSFTASKGGSIQFEGRVADNLSLSEGGNGVLFLSYTNLSSGNTFNTDKIFPFDASVDTSYDFDFTWEIPTTLVAGDYRVSIGATDGLRNVAEQVHFEVKVE